VPDTVKLPAATPVMVTVQAPDESSVQVDPAVPIVVSDEVKLTLPDGTFAALVVSTTVAVQEPVAPAVNEAEQETDVEVLSIGRDTAIELEVAELGL
jgi:hypothetical protein